MRRFPLAASLAGRLKNQRETLTYRWLERISDRVAIDRADVFPSPSLIDHIPLLIDGIADYLENPVDNITADLPAIAKAVELGKLRYEQGFDANQILREYESLGGILFKAMIEEADQIAGPGTHAELLECGHRVFHALSIIQLHTMMHFLDLAEEGIREREDRLRGFNRLVSHELKDRIGAARSAAELLGEAWLEGVNRRKEFTEMVITNLDTIQRMLQDLIELSRVTSTDTMALGRHILLPDVAADAKRELQKLADERGVAVEIADDLPAVEVPAAVVELVLNNFISNGIKYRDVAREHKWVRVEGEVNRKDGSCEVIVRVHDNGLGVPPEARGKLFERFFRAHQKSVTENGSGLGLAIVHETLKPIGGRVWAEFPNVGSQFAFAVPCVSNTAASDPANQKLGGEPERSQRRIRRTRF